MNKKTYHGEISQKCSEKDQNMEEKYELEFKT